MGEEMKPGTTAIPPHVPPGLVWDHDINEYLSGSDDPYLALGAFYEGPKIIWARGASYGKPAWLPTRKDLIDEVMLDPVRFSSLGSLDVTALIGENLPMLPLESDPPDHTAYRRLLQPWFTPAEMRKLEPVARKVANDLIDSFAARGSCDFVAEFATLLPAHMFLALMGMPREMLPEFLGWVHGYMRAPTLEGRISAMRSVKAYIEAFVQERRDNPGEGLVPAIIQTRFGERDITREEILGTMLTLFLGGLDTVTSSLGWHIRHLALNPALQSRLRDNPDDIAGATEDLLRAYGVNQRHRVVSHDLTFHGVEMKKGDWVMAPLYLAGRDPSAYSDPDVVDPDRNARHITFASGIHLCLGIHLARREIRIVIEETLRRLRNIRITPGEQVRWHTTGVWGVSALPLSWDL